MSAIEDQRILPNRQFGKEYPSRTLQNMRIDEASHFFMNVFQSKH